MGLPDFILRAPVFGDENRDRSAALLHFLLLFTIAANLISIPFNAIGVTGLAVPPLVNLMMAAFQAGLMVFMRWKRQVMLAGFLFTASIWAILALMAYRDMGIINPLFSSESLAIAIAGLLVSGWVSIGFAGLSSLFGLVLVQAAYQGLYPLDVGTISVNTVWMDDSLTFLLISLVVTLGMRLTRQIHERALKNRDERMRLLISNIPTTFMTVDNLSHVRLINRSPSGRSDDLIGKPIDEVLQPQEEQAVREALQQVFARERVEEIEFKSRNSETAWYSGRFAPIKQDGKVTEAAVVITDISAQKALEADLRASEDHYRQLFENNPNPMYIVDWDTLEFLDVNDAALEHYGYSRSDFLHMTLESIRLPEDIPAVRETMQAYEKQPPGNHHGGFWQHRKRDGGLIWVDLSVHRMTYKGRRATLVAPYDLTQQIEAVAALRDSEELFSTVFEFVPVGIGITTVAEGRIVNANKTMLKMLGFERDELVGTLVRSGPLHIEPAQSDRARGILSEQNVLDYSEFLWHTKSGEILNVLGAARRVTINGEECILGVGVDITERKRSEEALRRSEELFSKIFQTVPAAISLIVPEDGRILRVNDYLLAMLGYAREEVINRRTSDLWMTAEVRESLHRIFREKGRLSGVERQWHNKSGDKVDVLIWAEPAEVDGAACVLTIAVDITERKRVDTIRLESDKLRLELEKERDIMAMQDRFITTMSHEFRTPLAVILAAKESLQHYYDRMTPERRDQHYRNIDEQIRFLTELLGEILTINRVRAGTLTFEPERMDALDFCRQQLEHLELMDRGRHRFIFEGRGDLKDVEADRVLLQHILNNLLSNAVKFSPQDSPILLEVSRENQTLVLRVSDQGIGLSKADQAHLFEPFFRGRQANTSSGTGLGLAIVLECVRIYGGHIQCESEENKGSVFTVRLPLPAS